MSLTTFFFIIICDTLTNELVESVMVVVVVPVHGVLGVGVGHKVRQLLGLAGVDQTEQGFKTGLLKLLLTPSGPPPSCGRECPALPASSGDGTSLELATERYGPSWKQVPGEGC